MPCMPWPAPERYHGHCQNNILQGSVSKILEQVRMVA